MSHEFDASLVCDEPVSEEAIAEQRRSVERLMQMPNAFANAMLHTQNEMRRLISACNRLAWRSVPADLRAPSPEEKAALLERLSPEDREKLMTESRLAAKQRILVVQMEEAQQFLLQQQAEPDQGNEFDASLVYDEPVGADVVEEQMRTVGLLMKMPAAFANAQLHAQSDLQRLIQACNRLAWRSVPADLRAPTAEEKAALLERLSPDDRDRLLRDSQLAVKQRSLVTVMDEAHRQYLVQLEAEKCEMAEREALARLWAEFEAHDAAEKEMRFAAWRAAHPEKV